MRVAVVLNEPVSRYAFRTAVRALTGVWAGPRNLIVTSDDGRTIQTRWMRYLRAVDPDIVLTSRRISGSRTRGELGRFLDSHGLSPRWIEPFSNSLSPGPGWQMPVPRPLGAGPDLEMLGQVRSALPGTPTPFMEALLGLPLPEPAPELDAANTRTRPSTGLGVSVVRGSPVAQSVGGARATLAGPFLLHDDEGIDAALWAWNIRAVRLNFRHGDLEGLGRYISGRRSLPARFEVVHIGPEPAELQRVLDDLGIEDRTRIQSVEDYRPFRTAPALFERERYEVSGGEETIEIAVPRLVVNAAGTSSQTGPSEDGSIAITVSIEPADQEGVAISYPHRRSLNDALLMPRLLEVRPIQGRRLVQSRIDRTGRPVILVSRATAARPVPIVLPSLTDALNKLDVTSDFSLSDKGRYARWMASHLGIQGLHELLVDQRSQALLAVFQSKRLMTLPDMRATFSDLRHRGELPRRIVGGPSDRDWLDAWIGRQVEAKVLMQGISAKCRECLAESFMPFGTFTDVFRCIRCGAEASTPAIPRVGYQLGEVPFQFFGNNGAVPALALVALGRRAVNGFSFDFDHLLKRSQSVREIDLIAVLDGELAIGEAKVNGRFDDRDMSLLRETARRLDARFVVLAADLECEGGCGADCVEAHASRDTCLPRGHGNPGQRERVERLRAALEPRQVIVLCRGALRGPYVVGQFPL